MILLWGRALESETNAKNEMKESKIQTVSQSRTIEIALNYATHVHQYNRALYNNAMAIRVN